MTFLEKLDFLMEKYDLNKSTLSQASNIPYTTIDSFYKKGYENAKLSTIQKLADYFNTTLDYLMRDEITDLNFGRTFGFDINYDEMERIKKYRDLDDHGKEIVDIVLEKEYDRCHPTITKTTAFPRQVLNAAHDEGATEEQKAHADKIMDDDSEWE